VEKLKSGEATLLPSHQAANAIFSKGELEAVLSAFGLWFEEGAYDLNPDKPLNEVFPEIKTRKVKEFLQEAWKAN
jgi:hypothetical protein